MEFRETDHQSARRARFCACRRDSAVGLARDQATRGEV